MAAHERLALFPLSTVVLFPHVKTPLHIFEPRYRQMTEQALAGDRRIGMVVVRPEHLDAIAGDPPLFAVGCEGVISDSKLLPDGRFDIVLLGTRRFRIAHEIAREAGRLYRSAEVEPLEDAFDPAEQARVVALRHRTIELASELIHAPALTAAAFRDLDDVTFVNAFSHAFSLPPAEKQSLLEAGSIPERYERLVSTLGFHAAARKYPTAPSTDAIQ
jgi:Lon protease-like protein